MSTKSRKPVHRSKLHTSEQGTAYDAPDVTKQIVDLLKQLSSKDDALSRTEGAIEEESTPSETSQESSSEVETKGSETRVTFSDTTNASDGTTSSLGESSTSPDAASSETRDTTPVVSEFMKRIQKLVSDDKSPKTTVIHGDSILADVGLNTAMMCSLHFDSNIFVDTPVTSKDVTGGGGDAEKSVTRRLQIANKDRFVTNKVFENSWLDNDPDTLGRVTMPNEASAASIQQWLEFHGKIPQYVELFFTGFQKVDPEKEDSPLTTKGYGIRAKRDIMAGMFLGYYEGLYAPTSFARSDGRYTISTMDFDGTMAGIVDAENMVFSNWTRFINDGTEERLNCTYHLHNHRAMVFATKPIKAGEELVVSYGPQYWKSLSIAKLN